MLVHACWGFLKIFELVLKSVNSLTLLSKKSLTFMSFVFYFFLGTRVFSDKTLQYPVHLSKLIMNG